MKAPRRDSYQTHRELRVAALAAGYARLLADEVVDLLGLLHGHAAHERLGDARRGDPDLLDVLQAELAAVHGAIGRRSLLG
jgi:hypothetical protein